MKSSQLKILENRLGGASGALNRAFGGDLQLDSVWIFATRHCDALF